MLYSKYMIAALVNWHELLVNQEILIPLALRGLEPWGWSFLTKTRFVWILSNVSGDTGLSGTSHNPCRWQASSTHHPAVVWPLKQDHQEGDIPLGQLLLATSCRECHCHHVPPVGRPREDLISRCSRNRQQTKVRQPEEAWPGPLAAVVPGGGSKPVCSLIIMHGHSTFINKIRKRDIRFFSKISTFVSFWKGKTWGCNIFITSLC